MVKEFNLSENITKCREIHKVMEEAISTGKTGCMVMTGESTFLHTSFVEKFIKRLKEDIKKECSERYLESDGVMCEKGDLCPQCEKKLARINELAGDKFK